MLVDKVQELLLRFSEHLSALTEIQEHLGKLHVEAVPSAAGVMEARSGAVLMHSMCQLVVAVGILHPHALGHELLLALDHVSRVHIGASRSSDAVEQGLIGLAVGHHARQTLPGLLLGRSSRRSLPSPHRLGDVDIACVHSAMSGIHGAEGEATCGLNASDGVIHEGLVTEAANVALVGQLCHLGDLTAEGLGRELAEIVVLHPVHRKEVAQARAHILALHDGCITAVSAPRRLICV
mmetsp:Transcript_124341/g.295100  ORF Transcript_124341/g.295100 Transcript_124341/m.295100 type:complete len:237 (+) Transcript_124341:199-909(+)